MEIDYTRCWWNPERLEYNLTRFLNKCMHAVTRLFFFTFPISKELYIFWKKNDKHGFLSYPKHYLSTKKSSRRWCLLGLGLVKSLTFSYKRADFSVIVNISVKALWRHAIHAIFPFFIFSIPFKSWWFLSFLLPMINI